MPFDFGIGEIIIVLLPIGLVFLIIRWIANRDKQNRQGPKT
jgi:hypothetical protein